MKIESVRKGRTMTIVVVGNVDYVNSTSTAAIAGFAVQVTGNEGRHFGTRVKHYPVAGMAEVTISTD